MNNNRGNKENVILQLGQGHIQQFDFIKGIAIIFVIFIHAGVGKQYFYNYWNGQAVPLFIMVSCLLACLSLSKNDSITKYFAKTGSMLKRISIPFVLTQILIVSVFIIFGRFSLDSFFIEGGIVPGSYFPWLYIQLWLLMPFLFFLM